MFFGPFPPPPIERTGTPAVKTAAPKSVVEKKKTAGGKPVPQGQAQSQPQPQGQPQAQSQAQGQAQPQAPAQPLVQPQPQEDALTLARALSKAKAQAQTQAQNQPPAQQEQQQQQQPPQQQSPQQQPSAVHYEEHLPPQAGQPEQSPPGHAIRGKVEPPAQPAAPSAESAPPEPQAHPVAGDAGKNPRMVVVIDDIGDHPVMAKNLTELPFPVTLAILPNRPRTRSVEAMATEQGLEIILHQPMQPGSYPRVNPGPGAVFIDMDPERVKSLLADNLAQVPHVKGINNHMGSTFTSNPEGMAAVMSVLKEKGLFFLDSVTSATSAAPEAARKAGVPFYRRAVFLDNVRNVRTILGQLKTAERNAVKNGRAIAIGHPYGETLEALKLWAKERDSRVDVVTLTELGPEF
ncbi:divergent polysaccharide deacetylase family protein [Desulfovibrio aerotolerans]|uniref:Divergent polysaccharide deacetylase family protein n=2 Tax=Solidesulfovibrio aerotolerans TaxID=295255 RepID=A0A7C9IJE7_9BACT|nr:divergent polysaccharide deacetylase family protein [Solidesulfovibrio aerotolerans]MYL82021.1 divergent polysaccharide deacetylase family protein [Solidesulfovibrio aerotolerans]